MGIPVLEPLLHNHGQVVCLSNESFGMCWDRYPEGADIVVIMRDPIARLKSASRVWQAKFSKKTANYKRMLDHVEVGSTENHVVRISDLIATKLKGRNIRVVCLEDADKWSKEFGITINHLRHTEEYEALPLRGANLARAKKLFKDDIDLYNKSRI